MSRNILYLRKVKDKCTAILKGSSARSSVLHNDMLSSTINGQDSLLDGLENDKYAMAIQAAAFIYSIFVLLFCILYISILIHLI